jgi:PAS domain S-box-containing protein
MSKIDPDTPAADDADAASAAAPARGRQAAVAPAEDPAFAASLAMLRQFGEASPDLLCIGEAGTARLEYLSPAFTAIHGVEREHMLSGNTLRRWVGLIHPEDRREALDTLRRARAGERVSREFRIVRPMDGQVRWLHATAFPLRDRAGRVRRLAGIAKDVTGMKAAAERLRAVIGELQHRTGNLIGVVQALADKTLAGSASLGEFRERFCARLAALARVHGLLSRLNEGDRVTFDELIRTELAAHGLAEERGRRISLDGPADVRLRSSSVQALALALHELAVNAVRYGALSRPDGRLAVRWRVARGTDQTPRLRIAWRESGAAMRRSAGRKPRQDFDRELIERILPYQLNAETRYRPRPNGLLCSIILPLAPAQAEGAG